MTNLLEIKEYLKKFYSKNEIYVTPVLKFLLAFVSLLVINGRLGYMELMNNFLIVLVVSLGCSFLPKNMIVLSAAMFTLLHTYALSAECALVVLAVFLLMFFLYFRFTPKDTLVVLLTPVLFVLKIPFVMPVAMGLIGSPVSIVSIACGVVSYYMLAYMNDNLAVFSAMDAETGSQKLRLMIDGLLDNRAMLVTIVVFAVTLVLVYTIRKSSMNYAWTVAIVTGISTNAVLLLICEFVMDLNLSVIWIFLGSILAAAVCMVLQLLLFNVDYSRTEIVSFEDDEYCYYVKAVPKNAVSAPEKRVKKINTQHRRSTGKQVKSVSSIKTSHGVARTSSLKAREEKE